jgi:hypothetical protein
MTDIMISAVAIAAVATFVNVILTVKMLAERNG